MNFTMNEVLIFLAFINAATFVAFWADKKQSMTGGYRISEKTLLTLALFGGSPAAFIASRLFRHKTKKGSFRAMFWLVVIIQIIIVVLILNGSIETPFIQK